jgi:hypothetical protein
MRPANCPQEEIILKAVRNGAWNENLSAHLHACPDCRELSRASRWMQALANHPESVRTLPEPGRVWWRAQIFEKQAKVERAQDFLEGMEILSASVICSAVAVWLVWNWYAIQLLFTSILTGVSANSRTAASSAWTAPTILSSAAVIASIVAIVLAYPLLARD